MLRERERERGHLGKRFSGNSVEESIHIVMVISKLIWTAEVVRSNCQHGTPRCYDTGFLSIFYLEKK